MRFSLRPPNTNSIRRWPKLDQSSLLLPTLRLAISWTSSLHIAIQSLKCLSFSVIRLFWKLRLAGRSTYLHEVERHSIRYRICVVTTASIQSGVFPVALLACGTRRMQTRVTLLRETLLPKEIHLDFRPHTVGLVAHQSLIWFGDNSIGSRWDKILERHSFRSFVVYVSRPIRLPIDCL